MKKNQIQREKWEALLQQLPEEYRSTELMNGLAFNSLYKKYQYLKESDKDAQRDIKIDIVKEIEIDTANWEVATG